MDTIILFVAVFGVMYFMVIRPQKKQQAELKALRDNLKVGDTIITIGGIVAEILELSEEEVIVDSAGSRLKFKRKAIARKDEPLEQEQEETVALPEQSSEAEADNAFEIIDDEE